MAKLSIIVGSNGKTVPVEQIGLAVKPDDTIGEILGKISDKWSAYPLMQVQSFVFSSYCACCGKKMEINIREDDMYDDERWCGGTRCRRISSWDAHSTHTGTDSYSPRA